MTPPPEPNEIPTVDVWDAEAAINSGSFLLDVREPDEWAAGHAPAATHTPLNSLQADELPTGQKIYCICRSGGRSGAAVDAMLRAGFDAVNVAGGMNAWAAAGLPVVTDDGKAGTVI
jgi:rhodanese-related sulfurtransferase